MLYSDLYTKRGKKLPILLAFVLGAILVGFLWRYISPGPSIQATDSGLESIEITNIFQNQTTIVWKTTEKEKGWVTYGESEVGMDTIAYDERDTTNTQDDFSYHITTLKDLKPNTRYFFKITNGKAFFEQNSKSLFTFKTVGKIGQPSTTQPAYGRLVDDKKNPVGGAIVMLSGPDLYPLSALSKSSGEWLIPLNFTVSKKTNNLKTLSPNDELVLYVFEESGKTTKVKAKLRQISPLQKDLTLGQSLVLSSSSTSTPQGDGKSTKKGDIDIYYPKKNAVIPAGKPLIKGIASPDTKVELELKSDDDTLTYTVTSDKDGLWTLNLPTELEPQQYVLTVKALGGASNSSILTRTFDVAKSGTSVLGDSTPSGSTITPTLTATPSATPTTTLAQLPTIAPTASAPAQITNTPLPTLSITNGPTATPTPPIAGISMYGLAASSVVLMLVGAGLLVIF